VPELRLGVAQSLLVELADGLAGVMLHVAQANLRGGLVDVVDDALEEPGEARGLGIAERRVHQCTPSASLDDHPLADRAPRS
jgi:hypothetical protein